MKSSKSLFFLILGLLILNFSCSTDHDLKSIADNLRVKNKVPGMALAVVKADTILEMFTLGFIRKGYPEKIQLNDRFHIGSNTKAMTSFVAGHLVEEGKIDWSTTFIDLYPDWKTKIDSQYWKLTLGNLLSHRGKIQAFWTDAEFDSIFIEKQSKSLERNQRNATRTNFSDHSYKERPTIVNFPFLSD